MPAVVLAGGAGLALPAVGAELMRGHLVGGTYSGIACQHDRTGRETPVELYVDNGTAILDVDGLASASLERRGESWIASTGTDPFVLDTRMGRASGAISAHCRVHDASVRWGERAGATGVPEPLTRRRQVANAMDALRDAWHRGSPRAAREASALLGPRSLRGGPENDALAVEAADWLLDVAELEPARELIEGVVQRHQQHRPLLALAARQLEARIAAYRGDFAGAKALRTDIAREYASLGHAESADAIRNSAALVAAQSELGDEAQAYRDIVALDERARQRLGPRHPVAQYTTRLRAETALSVGRVDEAIETLERAQTGGSAWLDNQRLQVLAYAYREAGDAWRALAAVERSYLWRVDNLGADNLLTINAGEFLAYCLLQLGRVDEAIRIQRRAHAALERRLGGDSVRTLVALTNLAYAELLEGQAQQALTDLERVARGLRARLGSANWRTLGTRVDLAYAYLLSERVDEACDEFASVAREADPTDAQAQEAALNARYGLARCAFVRGEHGVARRELAYIHEERAKRFGPDGYQTLAALASLAAAYLSAGDAAAARRSLEELVELAEKRRRDESAAPGGGRVNFSDLVAGREHRAGYRDLAALYAREGRARDAIRISELARARSLGDALSVRDANRSSLASQRTQLRLRDLDARLRELDARIALAEPGSTAAIRFTVERDDVRAQLEALRNEREEQDAGFDDERLEQLVRRLPPDVAVIGLQHARDNTWAYVLRRGARPQIRLLASDARWTRLAQILTDSLADPHGELIPIWRAADGTWQRSLAVPRGAARHSRATAAAELSKLLLEPLRASIDAARRLIVIADGPAQGLPFELLPLRGKPLVHSHEVGYAPSLGVLDAWLRPSTVAPTRTLTAFAVSRFDTQGERPPGRFGDRRWTPLPATRDEVDAIAAQFQSEDVVTFTGAQATRDRLLQSARSGELSRTRYLHFATHALLDASAPQWSAIVLQPGGGSHGYVTAAELATLDIGAELVTLSACETARGRELAGEGLFGLPYALGVAGARATLLTLWPVADEATAEFMKRFYRRLSRGQKPSVALAATKREFLEHPRFRAPFYWAPFVLYGAN